MSEKGKEVTVKEVLEKYMPTIDVLESYKVYCVIVTSTCDCGRQNNCKYHLPECYGPYPSRAEAKIARDALMGKYEDDCYENFVPDDGAPLNLIQAGQQQARDAFRGYAFHVMKIKPFP